MTDKVRIIQDVDKAISVMQDAGRWLEETEKNLSKWWKPENLSKEFLLRYAKPEEFYVVVVDQKLAAAAILQFSQAAQDWQNIETGKPQPALYIHWLCVHRDFRKQGFPKVMVDFAEALAKKKGIGLIRVDTNAEESKLRKIYEDIGFGLVKIEDEGYRKTAFYERKI